MIVPKFEDDGLANGVAEMDENSKARLEEWRKAINNLPDIQDIQPDICRNEGGLLIQGALDVGFDDRTHDLFYKFYQGDRALLDVSCDCSSGSLCPARQTGVEMDGTWDEVYSEMIKLLKNKADHIPLSPA